MMHSGLDQHHHKDMLPENFNPTYASEWFTNYGSENKIHIYNLGKGLGEYVRANKLSPQFLLFTCDMHFIRLVRR